MTRSSEVVYDTAEYLEVVLISGLNGGLSINRLLEELDRISDRAFGQKFEIDTKSQDSVVFCAGTWAVSQLYGANEVATKVTILGETQYGPQEVGLSIYDNISFGIRAKH